MHPVSLSPFLSQAFISESLLLLCFLCLKGGKALLLSEVFSFSPGCTFKIGARSSLHGKAWPNQQVQARGYHSSDHTRGAHRNRSDLGYVFKVDPTGFVHGLSKGYNTKRGVKDILQFPVQTTGEMNWLQCR